MELKIEWIVLLAGIAGEFLVPAILGRFYKKYHILRDGLGKLSNPKSPVQWFYRSWQVLSGGVMIVGGIALWKLLGLWGLPLLVMLVIYGVLGRMGLGVMSVVDVYDVDWAPATVYRIFRFSGYFCLQFGVLVLSAYACAFGPWVRVSRMAGALMLVSAVMGILAYALSRMSRRREFSGTILQWQGLWELLSLLFLYLPLGVWSGWMLSL